MRGSRHSINSDGSNGETVDMGGRLQEHSEERNSTGVVRTIVAQRVAGVRRLPKEKRSAGDRGFLESKITA